MTTGTSLMPAWCAGSWAAGRQSQPTALLTLAGDRAPFGWTMFSAVGPKVPCPNAWPDLGVSATVTTEKTPALCAQVTSRLQTRRRSSAEDALLRGFVPVSQLQPRAGQQTAGWVGDLVPLVPSPTTCHAGTLWHTLRSSGDNRKGTMHFGQHTKSVLTWAAGREGKHRTRC